MSANNDASREQTVAAQVSRDGMRPVNGHGVIVETHTRTSFGLRDAALNGDPVLRNRSRPLGSVSRGMGAFATPLIGELRQPRLRPGPFPGSGLAARRLRRGRHCGIPLTEGAAPLAQPEAARAVRLCKNSRELTGREAPRTRFLYSPIPV